MVRVQAAGLRHRTIVALWILWGCAASASCAADSTVPSAGSRLDLSSGATQSVYDFDIPSQSLEAALIQYGVVSGHPALFPSDVVAGRTSSAVRGIYSAEAALHQLLDGTGLSAEKRDSNLGATFVLKEETGATANIAPVGMADLFNDRGYPGLVQARIWQALCTNARTEPGRYRILFRFQVDASGRINGTRLLRSSGEPRRDAEILQTLQQVHIDRLPPPALEQHRLTMLLVPSDPHAAPPCGQDAEAR